MNSIPQPTTNGRPNLEHYIQKLHNHGHGHYLKVLPAFRHLYGQGAGDMLSYLIYAADKYGEPNGRVCLTEQQLAVALAVSTRTIRRDKITLQRAGVITLSTDTPPSGNGRPCLWWKINHDAIDTQIDQKIADNLSAMSPKDSGQSVRHLPDLADNLSTLLVSSRTVTITDTIDQPSYIQTNTQSLPPSTAAAQTGGYAGIDLSTDLVQQVVTENLPGTQLPLNDDISSDWQITLTADGWSVADGRSMVDFCELLHNKHSDGSVLLGYWQKYAFGLVDADNYTGLIKAWLDDQCHYWRQREMTSGYNYAQALARNYIQVLGANPKPKLIQSLIYQHCLGAADIPMETWWAATISQRMTMRQRLQSFEATLTRNNTNLYEYIRWLITEVRNGERGLSLSLHSLLCLPIMDRYLADSAATRHARQATADWDKYISTHMPLAQAEIARLEGLLPDNPDLAKIRGQLDRGHTDPSNALKDLAKLATTHHVTA